MSRPNAAPRVYLFADFGKGPSSLGIVHQHGSRLTEEQAKHSAGMIGSDPHAYFTTSHQDYRVSFAARWWLVECENAAAGRRTIALQSAPVGASVSADGPVGRILDSGVRHA